MYKLHEMDGIERIRFVTSHPKDFSEKLIIAMRDLPKVCKHMHLPVQAGSDNVLALANLSMMTGNIGKESTGVNPLRGQNNVQGACDLGALPNVYPGYQAVDDAEIHKKFEKAWSAKLSDKKGDGKR